MNMIRSVLTLPMNLSLLVMLPALKLPAAGQLSIRSTRNPEMTATPDQDDMVMRLS